MKVTARIAPFAIASLAATFLVTSALAQAQYRGFPKSGTSPISQHFREEGKDNVQLRKFRRSICSTTSGTSDRAMSPST
jgi:hypothetical protein